MSELVCGNGMPAQWQKYPLSTQQEMMAGRMAIGPEESKRVTVARWADEGVHFLRNNVAADDLEYYTSWNVKNLEITLDVYRYNVNLMRNELIFSVTEKANAFVSHLTLTKILMIA